MNITPASTCAGVACDMHGRCQRYTRIDGSAEPLTLMGFPPREGCEHFVPTAAEPPKEKLMDITDESLSDFLAKLASSAIRQGHAADGAPAFSVTLTERGLQMLLAASGRLLLGVEHAEPGENVWSCKIGGVVDLPPHSDAPMRAAVEDAFTALFGVEKAYCFSGWGAGLTPTERAVVTDGALPSGAAAALRNAYGIGKEGGAA